MFAMPWFLTYFSHKLSTELIWKMWDRVICLNDQFFIFHFFSSLLIQNRQRLMQSEQSVLPQVATNLKVKDEIELDQIWARALTLREQTLHSFSLLPEIKLIFDPTVPI